MLCRHWENIFAEKSIDNEEADRFSEEYAVPFPEVQWELSKEEFLENIEATLDSAPGPDGLPYSA